MLKTLLYVFMYKNMFNVFLFVHVFYFLETYKIKPVHLEHIAFLPSFIALFSCILPFWGWVFSVFCI